MKINMAMKTPAKTPPKVQKLNFNHVDAQHH